MLPYHLKFPQEISLITRLSMAIVINYSFFQNLSLMYICNLRWHHNKFQTLSRCCRGIFNFLTLKIREIDLPGTCYIYADFQTVLFVELQNYKFLFLFVCTSVTNYILNLQVKFLKLNPMKFVCYHNISIFPKPT